MKWIICLLISFLFMGCSINFGFQQGIDELKPMDAKTLILPIWFPSGKDLIVSEFSYSELKSTIYSINLGTKRNETIVSVDGEAIAHALSPDGNSMAISIQNSNTFSDGIWTFNVRDGSRSYVGVGQAAAWSPNGRQLAIFSCTQLADGNSTWATLRLVDLVNNQEDIVFSQNNCFRLGRVVWSSADKIAFSYSSQNDSAEDVAQIYIYDLSTKKVWQLFGKNSWSPSFSPRGHELAYIKNYEITLSDVEGNCEKTVHSSKLSNIGYVTWSPDGTRLAASGMGKVYIIDLSAALESEYDQQAFSCP